MVLRNIADEVELPPLRRLPGQIGLIVEEVGFILTVGLQRSQHVAVGLIAEAVGPRELLRRKTDVGTGAKERSRHLGLRARRSLVGDVERRRHLVAIFGLEATRGESHRGHHIGIDDGEALLLSTAHKEGTIDLHVVDIDGVFVERTTAHVILGGQLRMGGDTGLRLHHFLDGVARDRRSLLRSLKVQLLGCALAFLLALHRHLAQRIVVGQLDHEGLAPTRTAQDTRLGAITNHRETDGHTVGTVELQAKLALEIGHGELALRDNHHRGQLDRIAIGVRHLALECERLGPDSEGTAHQQDCPQDGNGPSV